MQLSQLNPNKDPVKDTPALGKVIKQSIRTIIHLRTKDAKACGPQSRVADDFTSFSGQMVFVYVHIACFALWMLSNTGQFGMQFFDPFPYCMLAMFVSLEAIFLSTFLLIGQNCLGEETERRAGLEIEIKPKDRLVGIRRLRVIESIKGKTL